MRRRALILAVWAASAAASSRAAPLECLKNNLPAPLPFVEAAGYLCSIAPGERHEEIMAAVPWGDVESDCTDKGLWAVAGLVAVETGRDKELAAALERPPEDDLKELWRLSLEDRPYERRLAAFRIKSDIWKDAFQRYGELAFAYPNLLKSYAQARSACRALGSPRLDKAARRKAAERFVEMDAVFVGHFKTLTPSKLAFLAAYFQGRYDPEPARRYAELPEAMSRDLESWKRELLVRPAR